MSAESDFQRDFGNSCSFRLGELTFNQHLKRAGLMLTFIIACGVYFYLTFYSEIIKQYTYHDVFPVMQSVATFLVIFFLSACLYRLAHSIKCLIFLSL